MTASFLLPVRAEDGPVVVVGAGAAGLVTARELTRVGLEPIVIESRSEVGGVWAPVDASGVPAVMYEGLRTNLPTALMAFRDFPFESSPDAVEFVEAAAVGAYLRAFADHFGVRGSIRFGERVRWVGRKSGKDPKWRVELDSGRGIDAVAVAVANGHYGEPFVPDVEGLSLFTGEQTHSLNYRSPARFEGLRVLLVGARASGVDLALAIAPIADRVHLCARRVEDVPSLGSNIEPHPAISRLGRAEAVFVDGERRGIDAIVWCTGYRYAFDFLEPGHVQVDDNWVHPLHLDCLQLHDPTLAFVGLPFQVVPFVQFEVQAKYWVGVLSGSVALPPLPERETMFRDQVRELDARGVAVRHRLRHAARQFAYYDMLAGEVGGDPLPPWFARLHDDVAQARKDDPIGYRERRWSSG